MERMSVTHKALLDDFATPAHRLTQAGATIADAVDLTIQWQIQPPCGPAGEGRWSVAE